MTDRQMLEDAARAIGLHVVLWHGDTPNVSRGDAVSWPWNPLADDGDEARLETALGLNVAWDFFSVLVGDVIEIFNRNGNDKQASRRRAGVRVAASIGAKMREAITSATLP